MTVSEEQKVKRYWSNFREGSKQDFAGLYELYFSSLYNYGYRICGDSSMTKDAIQQLFIKLWNYRKRLSDTPSVKNYLLASLRHIIYDAKSSQKHHLSMGENYDDPAEKSYEFLVIKEQSIQEQHASLEMALSKLTRRQREAIYLKFYEGLNYEEISAIMSLTVNSSYNLVSKGIDTLRKYTRYISLSLLFGWLS